MRASVQQVDSNSFQKPLSAISENQISVGHAFKYFADLLSKIIGISSIGPKIDRYIQK
jgi:hypothetical protein